MAYRPSPKDMKKDAAKTVAKVTAKKKKAARVKKQVEEAKIRHGKMMRERDEAILKRQNAKKGKYSI